MSSIIEVKNLGKKYVIGERERYLALRDVLSNIIKSPIQWLKGKAFGGGDQDFWALKDVNFAVEKGEVLGIIGSNGAGKSTLLKILSQITPPTTGEIKLKGRVGSLLEVGTGFHPELTGRENIFLNGAILGMKKTEIEKKFNEIVEFSGIENFLDTPVKRYSSGMYVRLAFAVAAHLDPDILIIDEVLAVGDAEFQKKCLGKMSEVTKKEGRTVLFVSHNMDAVRSLCSRVVLLEKGKVIGDSRDVDGIVRQYLQKQKVNDSLSRWVNPGQELSHRLFTPLEFCFCRKDGSFISGTVAKDEEVFVRIRAEINEIDPDLIFGYVLYDEDGRVMFWSLQTDTSESQWPEIKIGINDFVTKFPVDILNEGKFKIELIAGLYYKSWILAAGSNKIVINLPIKGALSKSSRWVSKRPGNLAIVNRWVSFK